FTVGAPHDVEVDLEFPTTLAVPDGERSRPAYTQGIWTGPELGWVFVAVDGRLEGVARSVDRGFGVADVWVMVREGAVGVGDHDLALYAAEGDADDLVLRPLPVVSGPTGSVTAGG
ncbi:MAG: hypothetical protein ACR2O6_12125, partial [Ilumatobacteraceae bacterium]